MHARRHFLVLLALGLVASFPAAPALAQDAPSGSGTSTTDAAPPPLSPEPTEAPGSSGEAGTAGETKQPKRRASTERARTALPNTGADARTIAVLGLALVLAGIGLRLRTADAFR